MTRPYHLSVIKKHSTKTDAELAEIKARYANGVPSEIIDHIAGKVADAVLGIDNEPRVREIADAYRKGGAE
jgi:hypothetical protein